MFYCLAVFLPYPDKQRKNIKKKGVVTEDDALRVVLSPELIHPSTLVNENACHAKEEQNIR